MTDLWERLSQTEKPIVMYGTGDGADKIFAVLDRYGIKISDIFASDGFVRNRSFHGFRVRAYKDILEKYGNDFIILLSFASSLPDVMERIFTLAKRHELYAPDVPVAGDALFCSGFYEEHLDEIKKARSLLYDSLSKSTFDSVIKYKLTGDVFIINRYVSDMREVTEEILAPESYKTALDLGAYNGDTALELLGYAPGIEKIIAVEPDPKSFAKLCFNTAKSGKIEPRNAAAWSGPAVLPFKKGGSRSSKIGKAGKTIEVYADSADNILNGQKTDYIKYDVEGAEAEALKGSRKTIEAFSPDLAVSVYHRSEDIFRLILLVNEMNPAYRLYLRRFPGIPAWDLNLYAVKHP